MFGERKALRSWIRSLSHLRNMMVVVLWFGPVLLLAGQDALKSLMEQ